MMTIFTESKRKRARNATARRKKNRGCTKEKCLARGTYKYDSNTPYCHKREMKYEIIEGGSI